MITSPHNEKLKEVRRLQRRRERRFVAEGEDLLAAAADAGWPAVYELHAGVDVEADLLDGVSGLGSGTRALGVFEQRWGAVAGPLCVALWGVRDPGNVGAVLRSALAFGASSRRARARDRRPVRPQGGARVDGRDLRRPRRAGGAAIAQLPSPRVALAAAGGEALRGPLEGTLVIGAERAGLPEEVVEACDAVAHIPIAGDSLNAAMAATIALYESTRVTAP